MENPLPPAEELVLIDRELFQLDARRHYLLSRREWLLRGQAPLAWGVRVPPAGPGPAKGGPEASAPGAQNVLLILGAVLLAVAALAFTLVSWGSLGIAGRSAVLAVVTAAALGAPAALLRRGLRSTAEAVGAVGLLLTVLDAYALYAVGMPDTDGTAYAAGAAAVLAAVWAGYGLGLPGLRIPLPAAVLTAQLPLPLAALAAGSNGIALGWALLATAALDAALALVRPGRWSVWAAAAGSVAGGAALLTGLAESVAPESGGLPLGAAALLAAVCALGVAVAWRPAGLPAFAVAAGVAAVAAAGGLAAPGLESSWAPVAYLAVALALLGAVRVHVLPAPVRRGLALAGAGVSAVTAVWGASWVVTVLVGRLRVLDEVWAPTTPPQAAGHGTGEAQVVALLLTAAAAWGLLRVVPERLKPGAAVVAVALGWAGLFAAPVAAGLPAGAALAAQLAVTLAAGALALRTPAVASGASGGSGGSGPGIAAAACATAGALNVSLAALDGRLATFGVLGLLGAASAAGAAYGPAPVWARRVAAAFAVGYAALLAVALGALLELPVAWWGPLVLVVPAAVAALGPRLGPARAPAEATAAGAGLLAVLLTAGAERAATPVLALVLALAGVVCAGAAVRPERRSAGWAAGALFLAATWVRLAASGVTVPEAYTVPVTAAALAVGFVRRRRDPLAASWTAYGPGLAATLLPSTLAVWADPHWVRPLLLGAAALAVTLAGARRRLRAPLLLGGATLVAVALHELTPYVVQVVDALPRWLPPALAGVLC
ncbi:SCO7613 C-terminal domain-containing membrane protein, partial [Streptomyces sp. NPDC059411]|uniref:SCO7613 C-terminal domain-containing membrane protein n=1 Tax=Streptomyces sp. NPDC059411 TaxID=3346825 RepID=UPI00369AD1DE